MSNFKKYLLSLKIAKQERENFIHICSDWSLFCSTIAVYNRAQIMKLLSYLVQERPKSIKLLDRSIGRFNRLNQLRKDMLL